MSGERLHVLVVEDEPMIGRILEHKLRREGHVVSWATTTGAAAKVMGEQPPVDVALVDVSLDQDGIDFLAGIPDPNRPRLGWLVMAESSDLAARIRGVERGASGVVAKPFKPTEVAALVLDVAGGRPGGGR